MINNDDTSSDFSDDPPDHPDAPDEDPPGDDPVNGQGITLRMEHLIVALLSEPSINKACVKAQVPARTFHRWMGERPEFVSAYRKARRDSFSHAIALCQRYSATAVNTLGRIMTDTGTPASARAQAASTLLRFGRDGIEIKDLAARIDTLEQRAKEAEAKSGEGSGRGGRRWG